MKNDKQEHAVTDPIDQKEKILERGSADMQNIFSLIAENFFNSVKNKSETDNLFWFIFVVFHLSVYIVVLKKYKKFFRFIASFFRICYATDTIYEEQVQTDLLTEYKRCE